MLDNNHRVATVDQLLYHLHQNLYVLEVQTRCRFVENIERLAGVALAEFGRQLHTLTLATRECRRRLTQLDVTQAHLLHGF